MRPQRGVRPAGRRLPPGTEAARRLLPSLPVLGGRHHRREDGLSAAAGATRAGVRQLHREWIGWNWGWGWGWGGMLGRGGVYGETMGQGWGLWRGCETGVGFREGPWDWSAVWGGAMGQEWGLGRRRGTGVGFRERPSDMSRV